MLRRVGREGFFLNVAASPEAQHTERLRIMRVPCFVLTSSCEDKVPILGLVGRPLSKCKSPAVQRVMPVARLGSEALLIASLIAWASAHYVERQPQSPNHFDTVGQTNFQGGHPCITRPTIASASTIDEVLAPPAGLASRRRAWPDPCLSLRAACRSCAPPSRAPTRSRPSVPG